MKLTKRIKTGRAKYIPRRLFRSSSKNFFIGTYVLYGRRTIKCRDTLKWVRSFKKCRKHVADETINGIRISTVFLGTDYGIGRIFNKKIPPILFETMVFGGKLDQEMAHCSTWEQAEAMHRAMVECVKREEENEQKS